LRTPAKPDVLDDAAHRDIVDSGTLAFALRFQDRKRVHDADEIMAAIVAKRIVEHLSARDSLS